MIESENGVVTLTGTVNDASHKSLAQDTVASLPGVISVNNQLKISEAAPRPDSDAWLKTKIKATLLFHRNVSAFTEVSVEDRIVTLSGRADNEAEKELTAEYVMDIADVIKVNNEMTVADTSEGSGSDSQSANKEQEPTLGEMIDDASITAIAKFVLLSHRSTSALCTTVETKAGVVTLSGIAKNEAEIALATKLVSDSRGVLDVNNTMTVAKT
jgi:osmotically-inducible protein OsmY